MKQDERARLAAQIEREMILDSDAPEWAPLAWDKWDEDEDGDEVSGMKCQECGTTEGVHVYAPIGDAEESWSAQFSNEVYLCDACYEKWAEEVSA